jgi:Ca-activated chloride channel family protein
MNMQSATIRFWVLALFIAVYAAGIYAFSTGALTLLTPDQRAYRDYAQGNYELAAGNFADPLWQGVALFKSGDFKQSAGVFAGHDTADFTFNRGNALLMQGQYTEAADAYSRALELRPEWGDAMTNREIALGRAARLEHEGGDMTGGMLGADDIVFTTGESPPSSGEEETEGAQKLSDAEINGLWLRQVQTKPADFLAAKFAYQHATRPSTETEQEVTQ